MQPKSNPTNLPEIHYTNIYFLKVFGGYLLSYYKVANLAYCFGHWRSPSYSTLLVFEQAHFCTLLILVFSSHWPLSPHLPTTRRRARAVTPWSKVDVEKLDTVESGPREPTTINLYLQTTLVLRNYNCFREAILSWRYLKVTVFLLVYVHHLVFLLDWRFDLST